MFLTRYHHNIAAQWLSHMTEEFTSTHRHCSSWPLRDQRWLFLHVRNAPCEQVRVMQPMGAGVRRSLNPGPRDVKEPRVSAHWPRDEPLAALTPEDNTPPLQRREFGAEGLRKSTIEDSNGTPAEVCAQALWTHSVSIAWLAGRRHVDVSTAWICDPGGMSLCRAKLAKR